jgi:tetratricopeptide (TPR) repeat protein
MKTVSFVALIFLVFLNCAYYNTLFNAKKSFNAGIDIIQKEPEKQIHPNANKYFEDTIEKCWKLIEIYSDQSKYADDALLYIVKSEYYIGNYAQAKSHVNQFIQKYPESKLIPEANLWYGKLLLKDDQIDEGKEYLMRIINLSDDSRLKAEAFYELGNLAFEKEKYKEAIEYFEKALDEKIDRQYAAFINFYLGESYFEQQQYPKAIDQFKKVQKFSPSLDIEYKTNYHLGKSYVGIEKYDEGLKVLRKMLTAPRFKGFIPSIKSEIARINYLQGKEEVAIDLYTEVVRERVPGIGTAEASFSLGQIYENNVQNIDSAVFYYGEVRKLFSKYDSIEVAEEKYFFLSELKKIQDEIRDDRFLVYNLENDSYFRDSLYTLQYEDSLYGSINQSLSQNIDTSLQQLDTTSVLYRMDLTQLDSLKKQLTDSLAFTMEDSVRFILEDSLKKIDNFILDKAPKIQVDVEKRKLPEIHHDLMENEYHLAEFFLLQMESLDSAVTHYEYFLDSYEDSVLTPKAIYTLSYIYSKPTYLNENKVDSLENILISNYSDSPFTKEILRQRGGIDDKPTENIEDEIGYSLFLKAENFYFQNNLDSALSLYQYVASLDTNSVWSAKAQMARAWIYEKDLKNNQKAIEEYEILKNNFSQSEFVAYAAMKTKIPLIEEGVADSTLTPSDSALIISTIDSTTSVADTLIQATSGVAESDEFVDIPMVSQTKEYRDWRRSRSVVKQ